MSFPTKTVCWLIVLSLSCAMASPLHAQKVYVNSIDRFYEISGTAGNCTTRDLGNFCVLDYGGVIFSSAVHNGNLYFISGQSNNLYRAALNQPGSCTLLTSFPPILPFGGPTTINSMTVDRNGIIYAADFNSRTIYSYDPVSNQRIVLGQLPAPPAGDLMFYQNKLIYAANGNRLYEVNLSNPSASQLYMNTAPYEFYGIISFPSDCNKNKVYGISSSSHLVELDMVNKTVVGISCIFPWLPYDAASDVEDGNTLGITVDAIKIFAPCGDISNIGSVQIIANSAVTGALTFMLDNTDISSTGNFGNLSIGPHQIRITNAQGCTKDTSFIIAKGISPDIQIIRQNPESCMVQNGSLTIIATSNYPISYSVNNGPFQSSNVFNNLPSGPYRIRIKDNGMCERDTIVTLNYQTRPNYISQLDITPTYCNKKSGTITVQTNMTGITASIDNGVPVTNMSFTDLDGGMHVLTVFKDNSCRFDTLVEVTRLEDPAPLIQLNTVNQICFENNGSIIINATGNEGPYLYSLNNEPYSSKNQFNLLAPTTYTLSIQNINSCTWQMPATIKPYTPKLFDYNLSLKPANCDNLKSGEITLAVSGEEVPYTLKFNRQILPPVVTIPNLEPGKYWFQVINGSGCALDTIWADLHVNITPECDKMMLPSAFTPNGDGLNDIFIPIQGPFVKNVVFTIYNRYGQIVFQSKNGDGWDGSYKGVRQHTDVYVWTLFYENSSKEQVFRKGQVTLIR